jgi:hypothetical protein
MTLAPPAGSARGWPKSEAQGVLMLVTYTYLFTLFSPLSVSILYLSLCLSTICLSLSLSPVYTTCRHQLGHDTSPPLHPTPPFPLLLFM